jgi:hypothetical protein
MQSETISIVQSSLLGGCVDVAPKSKRYLSWFENEVELMRAIFLLYNNCNIPELDPMYSTGRLWRDLGVYPTYKFDLNPTIEGVRKGDARKLPFPDDSVRGVLLDPPFQVGGSSYGVMKERFTKIRTMRQLEELYFDIIKEAHRVMVDKSILIIKHQNCVSGGRRHDIAGIVRDAGLACGLVHVDELILIRHNPMSQEHMYGNGQQHTRSADIRFRVFRKKKVRRGKVL